MCSMRPLVLSVLVTAAHGLAGPVAGAATCVACIQFWCGPVLPLCVPVPPPGPGALACMAAACGIPCGAACTGGFCFDDSTQFLTPKGNANVSTLRKGDLVLTKSGTNGTDIFTEVTDIGYIEKDVEMLTLTFASSHSLSTSGNHLHPIAEGGLVIQKQTYELKVGMVMAGTRNGDNGTIVSIVQSVRPGKWSVATGPCSAYANGVLTGTSCSKIDVSMPAHTDDGFEPRNIRGKLADPVRMTSVVGGGNSKANLSESRACAHNAHNLSVEEKQPSELPFKFILSVDGKKKGSELGPAQLEKAVSHAGFWHLKAEFLNL